MQTVPLATETSLNVRELRQPRFPWTPTSSHPSGDPLEHRTTFVATEGELLAGGAEAIVWQQCGTGFANNLPVEIAPQAVLPGILA